MLSRRDLVLALLATRAWASSLAAGGGDGPAPLTFPRDFGAHPESRIEWWYVTGMLTAAARTWGFQITFFRAATGIAGAEASAFRAGELVFAHAAVTDLERRRLRHDQRLARSGFGIADASAAKADDDALAASRARTRSRRESIRPRIAQGGPARCVRFMPRPRGRPLEGSSPLH